MTDRLPRYRRRGRCGRRGVGAVWREKRNAEIVENPRDFGAAAREHAVQFRQQRLVSLANPHRNAERQRDPRTVVGRLDRRDLKFHRTTPGEIAGEGTPRDPDIDVPRGHGVDDPRGRIGLVVIAVDRISDQVVDHLACRQRMRGGVLKPSSPMSCTPIFRRRSAGSSSDWIVSLRCGRETNT